MPYVEIATVHAEGDPEDVLFVLPPGARPYREGDVIHYKENGGSTKYKIETVDSVILGDVSNPNPNNNTAEHRQPEVYYGVSVVP